MPTFALCELSKKDRQKQQAILLIFRIFHVIFVHLVKAIVEHNYTAKESDELTLSKGAIICNIKRQSGGWWEGTLTANGKTGMFPDNFVRVLDSEEKSPVVLR